MDRAVDTKALTKQILEGAEPRDVIATAVDEASVDEASTVTKKEVHGGKIVKRKHLKVHKHRILSAAQRKAIKKAQAMSQKGAAKIKRKKSLTKRAAALEGEGEEVAQDENYIVDILCPACGHNGMELLDTSDDEETAGVAIFTCPECGEEFVLINSNEAEADEEEADAEEAEDDEEGEGEEAAEEGTDLGDEDPTTEEEKPEEEVCGDEEKEDENEPLYFEPDDED